MSESMFGAPRNSVANPTRKNLKFTNTMGSSNRNCVNAYGMSAASPVKNDGCGQPNMRPMDI